MRILYSLALLFIAYASTPYVHATGFVYEYEEEQAEASPIPEFNSFNARTRGVPILVEFSTPWCRYCEVLGVCAVESIPTAKAPQRTIFLFFFVA
jgi:hypothetical protein